MTSPLSPASAAAPRWAWLPAAGTWKYHALLLALGILVLGPLGAVTASYMNFSIGFFVGAQVLAGLLGSTVTLGYGAEGKHGANYIQTAAASVAGIAAGHDSDLAVRRRADRRRRARRAGPGPDRARSARRRGPGLG